MPELPEVETTKNGLAPYLEGNTFVDVEVNFPRLRYPIPALEPILNKKISSITRRAKYLLINIENSPTMVIHLGMSGSLLLCKKDQPKIKHDHVVFTLKNGTELRYNDPRRFGSILLYDDVESFTSSLGMEPLEDEFNGNALYKMLQSKPKSNLKTTIMDGKILVGVGNIYACESLFLAGLSPLKKGKTVNKKQAENLAEIIKETLHKAIEAGGSTLKDFKHSDGKLGYFQHSFKVYGRGGEPCFVCKKPIAKIVIGQRSTFYCSKCQK
jgi:formamidopyrimidine-DNA glycosylase